MALGFSNQTVVSLDNLTKLGNISRYEEFYVNVSHDVYGGWLFFIALAILWFVLYQSMRDAVPNNMTRGMYSGAVITILSLLGRAVQVSLAGDLRPLLTDAQLWVFPLITLVLAWILWATRD